MIEFSNQFVSIKINANVGEGQEIAQKYHIEGVPQMVFINNGEEELDRIIGYREPVAFIDRVQDILDGKKTLPDLRAKLEKEPDNREVLSTLADKYKEMGNTDGAIELYQQLLNNYPNEDSKEINGARYALALNQFYDGNKSPLETFIVSYPASEYVYEAYSRISRFYAAEKDTLNEIKTLTEWSDKYPDDPSALNAFAWRMSQLETKLEEALEKAHHAVSLTADRPADQAGIIDTEAEVLWKLGRIDEAVKTIERAISIDPEYQYYKDQKKKFLESA